MLKKLFVYSLSVHCRYCFFFDFLVHSSLLEFLSLDIKNCNQKSFCSYSFS